MRFNFWKGNISPFARETTRDITDPLIECLKLLGHEVAPGGPPHSDTVVMLEYFTAEMTRALRDAERFIVIATEWFDGGGFNKQRSPEWDMRFNNFLHVISYPGCKAVWCLTPETVELCKHEGVRAAYFDIGHVAALEQKPQTKQFDFGFCGTMTDARRELLNSISHLGTVAHCNDSDKAARDALLSMCRWSLGTRPDLPLPYPSATRGPSSLLAGTPVILEPVERPTVAYLAIKNGFDAWRRDWNESCRLAKENERIADWAFEEQMEGFRKYPMPPVVEKMLDLTLGAPAAS